MQKNPDNNEFHPVHNLSTKTTPEQENRKTFNSKRKPAQHYDIDDLVPITKTQFATGAKLKTKNSGPYKVTKVKPNDRYDIEKVGLHEGPSKTSTSAVNMKRWPRISIIKKLLPCFRNKSIMIEGSLKSHKSTLLNFFTKLSICDCISSNDNNHLVHPNNIPNSHSSREMAAIKET